jgi:hypothetical protein
MIKETPDNRFAVLNDSGTVLKIYRKRSYAQEHLQQLQDYIS